MNTSKKMNPKARHNARYFALQALYQWQLAAHPAAFIAGQFAEAGLVKADVDYFNELVTEIPQHSAELDQLLQPCLDRKIAELDPIELTILRIATYELTKRLDVPYRVVINEAVELAKLFGASDGHKYVNGVLDRLAHALRTTEAK